ncbi:MAG: DUF1549 domain-containing protein [Verrucomicrobiota bacterium]
MKPHLPLGVLILLAFALVLIQEKRGAGSPPDSAARIDAALMAEYDLIQESRQKSNRTPLPALPPAADDATFLRRACVDLAGRLPRAEEARAFLADSSPGKRARLTDALVKEPAATEARFQVLAGLFRVVDDSETVSWLRQAARDDLPFDQVIQHMVGGSYLSRRDAGNPLRSASAVAFAVLGTDLHCALCHDHPFADATQHETYEFAACFVPHDKAGPLKIPENYHYSNAKPGEVVSPRLLPLTREKPPAISADQDARLQVADWILHEPSHRFAKVAALRLWSRMFGMPGLWINPALGGVPEAPPWHHVHPKFYGGRSSNCFGEGSRQRITWIDTDFHTPDKPSSPVKALTDEFLRAGGRIGEFQRILARTEAYQRASIDYNLSWDGSYLAPAPHVRRLPAEVIWSTLSAEKAADLSQIPPVDHPLRVLGRGDREWTDASSTPISHELARLMILGGSIHPKSLQTGSAEDLFLTLLGRNPSGPELASIAQNTASSEDIAWALLNTKEFMFIP